MKIASFLITAAVNVGIGALLFLVLIMALNGFSEREATPGLILFFVWVLVSALLTAFLSMRAAKFLAVKKSFTQVPAAALAILIFIVAGGLCNFVGLIMAIGLVSALR